TIITNLSLHDALPIYEFMRDINTKLPHYMISEFIKRNGINQSAEKYIEFLQTRLEEVEYENSFTPFECRISSKTDKKLPPTQTRSEEHTSELQSRFEL